MEDKDEIGQFAKLNFWKINAFPIACICGAVALQFNGSNHWFWLVVLATMTVVFPRTNKDKNK